jgi:hypothetical protein
VPRWAGGGHPEELRGEGGGFCGGADAVLVGRAPAVTEKLRSNMRESLSAFASMTDNGNYGYHNCY